MPRYVILEHDQPELHWDFMLETSDLLKTWKLSESPHCGQIIKAILSFDHRLVYLDYEGPISGGRGSVIRWDWGSFEWKCNESGFCAISMDGFRIQGYAELSLVHREEWQLRLSDRRNISSSHGEKEHWDKR